MAATYCRVVACLHRYKDNNHSNGQGFILNRIWRMKQGGGMRVVDHVIILLLQPKYQQQ